MISGATFWAILATAILAAIGLSWLEWTRANPRHLAARVAATLVAIAALVILGFRPTWQRAAPAASGTRAVLWTPLTPGVPAAVGIDVKRRFALPGAASLDPAATPVPDAAYLRRHDPEIDTLRILGDGLDSSELAALRGLHVEFTPPASAAAPGLRFLRCPRELALGDPLVIQGKLGGLAPNATIALTLESPDATVVHADTAPADDAGEATFTLRAPSLPAAGRFLWRLRAPASRAGPALDLPLGVAVVAPDLPRLLILEAAPRFDSGALRRWFETAGGSVITRTRVGQDKYRYAATTAVGASPPGFAALDAPVLDRVDLLLADTATLAALPPAERAAILAAVADTGLGLLVLPDDSAPLTAANALVPWKLSLPPADPAGPDRTARLRWPGQVTPTELPIPVLPGEILPGKQEVSLLGDGQDRTLAATHPAGRGQLALTLVRDTARWQRENDSAAFAAYWSHLFSRLARSADASAGRWLLADGEAGPVFVDHPLELRWSGPASPPPGPAVVASPAAALPTTLALAPDPAAPGHWRGTFWPRRPGWHRVTLASGGPALDFYVSTADAWPALDASRRRAATDRFAQASSAHPAPPAVVRQEFPPVWLALAFFLAAGYLWIERRFAE